MGDDDENAIGGASAAGSAAGSAAESPAGSAAGDADANGSDSGHQLRTSSAATIGWIAIAAAGVVAVLLALQVPPLTAVTMLGMPCFIAVVGWACYLRPRVHLHSDSMRIVNIMRTYDVPFARIDSIDLRLGVTLRTDAGKRIGVWSLPNTGRRTRRLGLTRGHVEAHVPTEVEEVTGALARWRSLKSARGDDAASAPGREDVRAHVQLLPIALCALTAAWAVWGLGASSVL